MRVLLAVLVLPMLLLLAACHSPSEPSPEPDAGVAAGPSESSGTASGEDDWWESDQASAEGTSPHEGMHGMPAGSPHGMAGPAGGELPDSDEGPVVKIGGGHSFTAPEGWNRKQPKPGFVRLDAEFAVPAVEGEEQDGRVTVMAAGGSVQDNIERWYGQFTQPDGSKTEDKATVEDKTVAGVPVHLVDISGTYNDSMGPFAGGGTERPGYRMMAAIIETDAATYFVKFYGPEKTVGKYADDFRAMIEGME